MYGFMPESEAIHELLKARIAAQSVVSRMHIDVNQIGLAAPYCFFEPPERLIYPSKAQASDGEGRCRSVAHAAHGLQASEHLASLQRSAT